MTTHDGFRSSDVPSRPCSLVILHETDDALNNATGLYEEVRQTCWEHRELKMAHWPMDALTDEETGEQAAFAAAEAHILVVAAEAEGPLPSEFETWTERWLEQRAGREGVLVGILVPSGTDEMLSELRQTRLHQLAVRAGMDYLTHLPETPVSDIPDLTEWCAARAETSTGTLNEIIRNEPRTSAWS